MNTKIKKNLKKHFVKISKKGIPVAVSTMMILNYSSDIKPNEKIQNNKFIENPIISEIGNDIFSFEKEATANKNSIVLRSVFCAAIGALSIIYDLFMVLLNNIIVKVVFRPIKFISEILLIFFILLALFWFVYKLFYPQSKFKDFFNKKTVEYLLTFSLLICSLKNIIFMRNNELYILKTILISTFIVLCIMYLWYKIFNLDGKFGAAIKNMFWGKKGKKTLITMISSILVIAVLKILLNKIFIWGKLINISVLFVLCFFNIFSLYNLCKGRFAE